MKTKINSTWSKGVIILSIMFLAFAFGAYFYFLNFAINYNNTSMAGVPQNITETRDIVIVKQSDETHSKSLNVKIADSPNERTIGMAYVDWISEDEGMLFVFDDVTDSSFWMKNCLINLDIIFIDEKGVIVDILKDLAPCSSSSCPKYYASDNYRYVVEVNGGWSDKYGFEIGDKVIF